MNRYKIFDIPIDNVSMAEALKIAKEVLENNKQHKIFTLNPEILLLGKKDRNYKKILQSAELALPDGIGLVWLGRIFGMQFKERVAGADFMEKLAGLAEQTGKSIFLLGGENGVAEKTAKILEAKYPDLSIVGWLENIDNLTAKDQKYGLNKGDLENVYKSRNAALILSKADILFVALGAPKQEVWIYDNLPKLPNVKIAMGVGGAFDFISDKIPRAPKLLREIGLEWMWRLMMEPKKRFKRMINAVVIFPLEVIKHRLRI